MFGMVNSWKTCKRVMKTKVNPCRWCFPWGPIEGMKNYLWEDSKLKTFLILHALAQGKRKIQLEKAGNVDWKEIKPDKDFQRRLFCQKNIFVFILMGPATFGKLTGWIRRRKDRNEKIRIKWRRSKPKKENEKKKKKRRRRRRRRRRREINEKKINAWERKYMRIRWEWKTKKSVGRLVCLLRFRNLCGSLYVKKMFLYESFVSKYFVGKRVVKARSSSQS